jgi:hypothetical protein
MSIFNQYKGSRFVVWVQITADPHAEPRGFSIEGRELRVVGYEPVQGEMQDPHGHTQPGKFWAIEPAELFRVIPEMKNLPMPDKDKVWFLPVEFCDSFVRPYYYLNAKVVEKKLTY